MTKPAAYLALARPFTLLAPATGMIAYGVAAAGSGGTFRLSHADVRHIAPGAGQPTNIVFALTGSGPHVINLVGEVGVHAADTTIEQLTELQRRKPYSRVPVYDGNIDHIIGIVLTHDLLQITDSDARTRTVRQMMKPVHFIPETQRVSSLLREMQQANLHMAIVIDEYGSVAGVVTMEDLVEEIVGEIRDEHEPKADIIRESENSYVVPGNMDVDRLQELFNIRPEAHDATTVAGLVSEALGRIPNRGEVVERDDLRFEVLESTGRRVVRLRISSTPQHRQQMRA